MYIFNGKKLTEDQAKKFAEETGRDLQTFLEANPDIQEDPDFGPQDELGKPEVAVEEVAPAVTKDTALQSEDGSLEPARTSVRKKTRKSDIKKNIDKELEESIDIFEENLIDLNPSNLSQKDLMSVQNTAIDYLVSTSEDPNNYSYTEEDVNAVTKTILDKASGVRSRRQQLKDQVAGTTPSESLSAAWENLKLDFERSGEFWTGDSKALDLASAAIYNGVFGKENVDAYLDKLEGLPDGLVKEFLTTGLGTDELLESIPKFQEQQQRKLQTLPIIESFKQGEIIKGGTAILSGIISGVGSVGYGALTGGAGFTMDYVAENYIEFNEGLAERKNKSIEQLILDGEDNVRVPVGIAAVQSLAENIGIGKITKATKGIPKKPIPSKFFDSPYAIKTADILGTGTTEFTTEIVQGSLGKYNEALGQTGEIDKAFEAFTDHMTSQQGLEEGIQGFATGAGIKGGSYSLKAVNNLRSPDESEAIQADIIELGDLNKQAENTKSTVVKEGVEAKIKEVKSRLDSRITKGNSLFSKLTPTEIDEVNNMGDLSSLQLNRVKELNVELDKGKINRQEYLVALEGFKSTFIDAKNRIKGISVEVEKREQVSETKLAEDIDVEVSADNLLKSSINEENTAIVLDPESTPAQIDKAKTTLVENNQGIINNVINKSFKRGLDTDLTREEFAADISLEVQKLINTYGKNKKTGKTAPFGVYLRDNLPLRVPAIFDKQLQTVDGDIVGKVDVSKADQETTEDAEIETTETELAPERAFLSEEVVLPENVNSEINKVVTDLFSKGKIPEIGTKEFTKYVEGTYKNELKPIMAKFIGKNTDASLEIFLRENFKEIYDGIPQSIINKRFPAFKEAVLDKEGKQVREKTAQGNAVFKKKDITPAEFIKNFLGRDVGKSTQGTRKDALAETMAIIYANEASLGILEDAEVQKAFKKIQDLKPKDAVQSIDNLIKYVDSNYGRKSGKLFAGPLGVAADLFITALKAIKAAIKAGKSVLNAVKEGLSPVKNTIAKEIGEKDAEKLISNIEQKLKTALNSGKKGDISKVIDDFMSEYSKYIPKEKQPTSKPKTNVVDYEKIAELKLNIDASGNPLFRASNVKLVRKEIMKFFGVDYVNKKDTGKAYSTRDRNAKLPEDIAKTQGETFIEGSTRVVGDFLDQNPKWRNALRASTTAGVERGLFTTTKVFEELFPIKKGVKQEGIRYAYTGKGKLLSKKFADSIDGKDFVENQYKQIDNLIDFFLDVESYLKKNTKDAWVFDAIVKDAQDNQNSIFRSSAPILFLATDSKGKLLFNVPLRQEHSMPQNNVSTMLLDMAINGRVKQDSKAIKATYMQGGLTMADDGLLDVDYKFTMPKVYWEEVFPRILSGDLKLPNGLAAVIRMTESGVDLDNLKYLVTGKSISEFFFDTKGVPVEMQKELISDYFTGKKDLKLIKDIAAKRVLINPSQANASKSNNNKSAFKFSKAPTNKLTIDTAAKTDEALNVARDLDAPIKKIRVFDFDDTLAQTKSDVLFTMPDGTEGKLNAEQFASDGSTLLSEGAVFDFSEFNKVTEGKKGPLFKVAQTIAAKRGTEDVFVLTARAPESQLAIYEFLKSQGLNIPLKNITGLGNSTGDAKARWIVDKAADGYNDFYFADDAPQNVKAVRDALSVIDVKSKTQQAKIKFSKSLDLNKDFNDIIENKTGIASDKTYARVKAEVAGASKGKFNFFIPPSAEDFVGLLYSTLGKGDVGDAQMAWYKSHLLNPFARAMENLANDRANMMQDFRGLKKSLKIVPKNLRKKIKDSDFTQEQAVRAYIWDKQGMEIPGLSQKDQQALIDFVNEDANLTVFADQLIAINKGDAYAAPDAGWVAGSIDTDFIKALNTTKRSKYLEVWQQNADQIFSETNLNKLEAAYGANYKEAMVDMLKRMKTGKNTSSGSDRLAARFTDWLTNSVGAIMFFNTRSAVLQTISAVNFINFSDNNVLKAGAAFANQPQYWKDFKKLFNSPFLLDRRSGLKLNVNEADIADMAKGPGNSARNVIAGILKAGFLPTQLADSFAIASGGASFYRNRIKALQKEGLTEAEAEEQAFRDFREIAEESQQSSRPDKISQQQAGPLGRVVLAFANTPAQYARLIKKAASDLKNGRGDAKTNISKIIYYGVAQNLLFSALQQALFAIAFDDDEEEEKKNEKYFNIVNGMSDSILRGIGVGGAIVSVVKNTAIRLAKEADKKSPKYQDAVVKGVLQISPPISSKVGKLQSAGRSFSWNQEEMRTRGWSIDNPAYLASANVISAATNVPLDRAVKKITNIVDAGNEDIEYYKRVALALGWSAWELGIDKKGGKIAPPKTNMDKLYDLNKKEQIDSLLSLGLSKKQIKLLKLEEDRVKAILDPKSIKKIKVSKKDSLFGLNKKDQVKALEKLGLTKKEIRALRLESDRVEAIINKQKKEVK